MINIAALLLAFLLVGFASTLAMPPAGNRTPQNFIVVGPFTKTADAEAYAKKNIDVHWKIKADDCR